MAINAYEQIKQTLGELLERFPFEKRELSQEEIQEKLENGCGKGGYGTWFLKRNKNSTVSSIEYQFHNGLFFLDSEIYYKDNNGNSHTMRQFTLTSNYYEEPFVNIVLERDLKSYRQLITETSPKDDLFPISEKDVEIEKVKIGVNGTCGDTFTIYKDLRKNTLLKEEYRQGYPIIDQYVPSLKLLKLCGCFDRKIEIVYGGEASASTYADGAPTPIYAQLSEKYKVEDAGFNPNSREDAEKMISIIQEEVNAIVELTKALVENYLEIQKPVQKTIGTNPEAK